jgi:hypothetical protein
MSGRGDRHIIAERMSGSGDGDIFAGRRSGRGDNDSLAGRMSGSGDGDGILAGSAAMGLFTSERRCLWAFLLASLMLRFDRSASSCSCRVWRAQSVALLTMCSTPSHRVQVHFRALNVGMLIDGCGVVL